MLGQTVRKDRLPRSVDDDSSLPSLFPGVADHFLCEKPNQVEVPGDVSVHDVFERLDGVGSEVVSQNLRNEETRWNTSSPKTTCSALTATVGACPYADSIVSRTERI